MWTGFTVQTALVVVDLAKTAPNAPPYLESLHPALMGQGVIPAMLVSGLVFVGVSLATRSSETERLELFFSGSGAGG